jgi:hypothetical protein
MRQQLLQCRPFHRTAGEAAVIVGRPDELPALARLASDSAHGGITKIAETHLNSSELALELTKLTLQGHTASNTSWVTLASDPDKWGAYVRDVYDKCLKGLGKN